MIQQNFIFSPVLTVSIKILQIAANFSPSAWFDSLVLWAAQMQKSLCKHQPLYLAWSFKKVLKNEFSGAFQLSHKVFLPILFFLAKCIQKCKVGMGGVGGRKLRTNSRAPLPPWFQLMLVNISLSIGMQGLWGLSPSILGVSGGNKRKSCTFGAACLGGSHLLLKSDRTKSCSLSCFPLMLFPIYITEKG